MTLLAHWKMGGNRGTSSNGQTAVDSAAGGSGAHDGIYRLDQYGPLVPIGYDSNLCLRGCTRSTGGIIDTISNVSDLQLTGTMTLMFWFSHLDASITANQKYIFTIGAVGETLETNYTIFCRIETNGVILFLWEYDAGNNIAINSSTELLYDSQWHHVAVVRYVVGTGYGVDFYIDGAYVESFTNGGAGYTAPNGGTSGVGYVGRSADDSTSSGDYGIGSLRVYDTDESANVAQVYNTEVTTFTGIGVNLTDNDYVLHNSLDGYVYDGSRVLDPTSLRSTVINTEHPGIVLSGPELVLEENRNPGFHR